MLFYKVNLSTIFSLKQINLYYTHIFSTSLRRILIFSGEGALICPKHDFTTISLDFLRLNVATGV